MKNKARLVRTLLVLGCLSGPIGHAQPASAAPNESADYDVAFTFDDLPYVMPSGRSQQDNQAAALAATQSILSTLQQNAIPVTAFVNEDKVQALGDLGPRLLTQWNTGLFELANHGYHHFDSNKLSPAEVENEIVQGESSIRPMAEHSGHQLRFFRFPYNHTGNTEAKRQALSDIVQRHGYKQAATTIDIEDYLFNDAYECAYERHRAEDMSRIAQAYLDYVRIELPYYRALDQRVMGRAIPEVMLLHANRLNAAILPDIVSIFRHDHAHFVTLAQAQSDAAYAKEPKFATAYGPMWGYRWAAERHIAIDGRAEKEAPSWVTSYCKAP